ncbi:MULTISPECIES: ABC transporter ATP-binding protein [unclassified Streptomyces]|uniref:ABC transporter ATP-binding protein n=1 Tax=unclassified Streptomyces TaxID=2593676 RepID=UPI0027424936|nr:MULTISPECIES: ATP-binding cassette domain-containing protein [unclassified Streptomyces]
MHDNPGLMVEALTKRYGDHLALDKMSFEVKPGEVFGFVGSNGAGKTTTMRIAIGVLNSDEGAVYWRGKPVDAASRSRFGYMPEERGLYPKMTVAKQLVYLARLHGMSGAEAVAAMQTWTERLDVAQYRNRQVDSLSLGNQQRVQLAAALVHDPQVLLLDEPFSGLDPLAVDTMSAVLRERAEQGAPVLFSSHQLDLVERLCDRVGIVRSGSMMACGSVEELRARGGEDVYIEIEGAPRDWARALRGVDSFRNQGQGTVVRLADHCDEGELVRQVADLGRLRTFRRQQATLTELFRSYVTNADESTEMAA